MKDLTIAALGCSGPVASHIVRGFLATNDKDNDDYHVTLKLLARSPDVVAARYRDCNSSKSRKLDIVQGSMSNAQDVASLVETVDVCFLITPMGKNNQPDTEIDMATRVLEGLVKGNCKHLVYASVFETTVEDNNKTTGVGILDAKRQIEDKIQASGVPYTCLRCGSYMEDVFDPRIKLLNLGWFLFPINPHRQFCYTAQKDIPRFIIQELAQKKPLNTAMDFCEPNKYTLTQVTQELTKAAGHTIRLTPKFPVFYIFSALLPIFRLLEHRFSSVIPLMAYFDQYGYTYNSVQEMAQQFPDFDMTTLLQHLLHLFLKK